MASLSDAWLFLCLQFHFRSVRSAMQLISPDLLSVYFLYPETMGVPLEEMDAVFGEGR